MNKYPVERRHYSVQGGAVLFIVLISLLLVTILTSAAVRSVTQAEKMTSAAQAEVDTFQKAELALLHCEILLKSGAVGLDDIQRAGHLPPDWHEHSSMWESIGKAITDTGMEESPMCVIELTGSGSLQPDIESLYVRDLTEVQALYRVTSRSTGNNDRSESILESLVLH